MARKDFAKHNTVSKMEGKWHGWYNLPEVDNSFETEFSEWEVGHLKLVDGIAEWKGGIRDMTTAACGRSSLKVRGSRSRLVKGSDQRRESPNNLQED